METPVDLEMLERGLDAWNPWRKRHPFLRPNLSRASLSGSKFSGFDFSHADLSGAFLTNAVLDAADFQDATLQTSHAGGASFVGTNLFRANLIDAYLADAKFTRANLWDANLFRANLSNADLSGSDLSCANFDGARLDGSDVSGATMVYTNLGRVNLAAINGLEKVSHRGPSTVSAGTLEMTARSLSEDPSRLREVEVFLMQAGLPDVYLGPFKDSIGQAIDFYSCFISYSHLDREFAKRLHEELERIGVRCWRDEKNLKPGDRILDVVNGAIQLHDKLLLCCSKTSLQSWWVKDEIRKAQERERHEERLIIVPLNLDDYLFEWQDGLASDLTSRLAATFVDWEHDSTKFESGFDSVVESLSASGANST